MNRREVEAQMRETLAELLEQASAWLQAEPPTVEAEMRPREADPTEGRDPDVLLTAEDVAEILGLTVHSVYVLGGLHRVQLSERRVRWRLADVRAFVERRREGY